MTICYKITPNNQKVDGQKKILKYLSNISKIRLPASNILSSEVQLQAFKAWYKKLNPICIVPELKTDRAEAPDPTPITASQFSVFSPLLLITRWQCFGRGIIDSTVKCGADDVVHGSSSQWCGSRSASVVFTNFPPILIYTF